MTDRRGRRYRTGSSKSDEVSSQERLNSSGKNSPLIVISANSAWNIVNFRIGLVTALKDNGFRVVIACPGIGEAAAELEGFETIGISVDRSGINPVKDAQLLFDYARLFRRMSPDYFLGFTVKPNIYGSLAARWTGVRSLPNVSGLGTSFVVPGYLSRLVGLLSRIAFTRAPKVFFQNPDDRELFLSQRIVRPEQTVLLPGSGIDLVRFSPSSAANPEALTFLLIGRLLGDKGVREFVRAASLLREDLPGARFQLLGGIDDQNRSAIGRGELGQWIEQGLIEYLGEADDVRPYIREASVIVLPSYREGLPRSLLEGAAMGKPLIAADVPGCRQLVEEGVTGMLCEARNPQSLADAMKRFAGLTPERRSSMGSAAREMVVRCYDENMVIQAYIDALRELDPAARS